jgi:hypothetical protein
MPLMNWVLSIATFVGGGLLGFLLPHVQKPLTDYRKTLTEISHLMLRSVHVLFEAREKGQPASAEERKLYDDMRTLHARLLSSANSIPRFARPALQALGLLQSRTRILEGAQMLIGISNQLVTATKDLPHLGQLIKKLGEALDIAV